MSNINTCISIILLVFRKRCQKQEEFYENIHSLEPVCCCLVPKLCPTVCDPKDYSPPGPSVLGFPRQEYWSGLPFPSPGDLSNPGIKPASSAWQEDSSPLSHVGSPTDYSQGGTGGGNPHPPAIPGAHCFPCNHSQKTPWSDHTQRQTVDAISCPVLWKCLGK